MNDEKGFWAIIGKSSVLIGLVLGLIAAKNEFWPNDSVVVAKCHAAVIDALSEDSVAPLRTLGGMKAALGGASKVFSDKEIDLISNSLSDEVGASIGSLVTKYSSVGYGNCVISNMGEKNAENIELSVASSTYAVFLNKKRVDIASGRISVGTLKPGDSVRLGVFTIGSLSYFDSDEYSINYDDGVGEVLISEPSYGWVSSLARSAEDGFIWFFVVLGLFFLVSVYNLFNSIAKLSALKNAEKNKEKSPGGESSGTIQK
jgi:hypothetical protein